MYKAKDGKAFGNTEQGRHYDRTRKAVTEKDEPAERAEHAEPDGDEQPIEQSVEEHGPVEHIEMHSHHKDGHVHKSKHHDGASAHEHIEKAMPQPQAEPEPQAMAAPAGIPGMRE